MLVTAHRPRSLWILALLITTFSLPACSAQSGDTTAAAIEVASIHHVDGQHGFTTTSPYGGTRFSVTNASLKFLLELAYGFSDRNIISKLGWLDTEFYNVAVTSSDGASLGWKELQVPMQQLLTERFQLGIHHETKTQDGYSLTTVKTGPKLTASSASTPASGMIWSSRVKGSRMPMASLAEMLARVLDAPVSDNTAIKGDFDIDLQFAPDGTEGSAMPGIFKALQEQLGLELHKSKLSVDLLVVDAAQKTPLEN